MARKKNEEPLDVVEVEIEDAQSEDPKLEIVDIVDCVKVIDLCSKRGAFEGQELSGVGALRTRLVQFVNAHAPKPEESKEE